MFPLFRRARRTFSRSLELEPLERRDCLSNPPVMLSFSVTMQGGRNVILSGRIADESPGTVLIAFTGAAGGSTIADADGYFALPTQGDSLGTVYAQATDEDSLTSATAVATISSSAPVISDFTASFVIGTTWRFQGRVTDESAWGLQVRLGGLQSLEGVTVTVGGDNWFSIMVALQPGTFGDATAQTTDWWGLDSNIAIYYVA